MKKLVAASGIAVVGLLALLLVMVRNGPGEHRAPSASDVRLSEAGERGLDGTRGAMSPHFERAPDETRRRLAGEGRVHGEPWWQEVSRMAATGHRRLEKERALSAGLGRAHPDDSFSVARSEAGDAFEPNGGFVEGRVIDAEGEGVGGALVKWQSYAAAKRFIEQTVTASDGTFVVSGVPPRETGVLVAEHEGYASAVSKGFAVEAHQTISGVVIEMVQAEAGTITGRTQTQTGESLGGVRVRLMDKDFQVTIAETDSSPEGAFAFYGLPPGEFRLYARGSASGTSARTAAVVGVGESVVANLVFSVGEEGIAGRVVDRNGNGVSGFVISIFREGGGVVQGVGKTDEKGDFEVVGLPEGSYRVTARLAGWETASLGNVASGSKSILLETSSVGQITGRCMSDTRGEGCGPFVVSVARSDRTALGATPAVQYHGSSFSIRLPSAGRYDIAAADASGRVGIVRGVVVEDGAVPEPIEVQVSKSSMAVGRVIDMEGETPISGAEVSLAWPGSPSLSLRQRQNSAQFATVHTDEGGAFAIAVIPGEPAALTAGAPGFRRGRWTGPAWAGEEDIGVVALHGSDSASARAN